MRPVRPHKNSQLLEGLEAIAKYLDRSTKTVKRWIDQHAFPACKLPDGVWACSPALIDQWIWARGRAQQRLCGKIPKDNHIGSKEHATEDRPRSRN